MMQEMVRDCGHDTGEGQRLWTRYRKWSETVDTIKEKVRDCRHTTGEGQRLWTGYRRWSETADRI
ncbi:unnamed protein product [Staurois parvus]|uniref:Uncharacterized protein n=1 Tax=Staurois parvus TaxID=386267 RepID=A0ABN9FEJ4_9NEOB|nr:unnamed protein product [Staurois parvus]